MNEDMKRVLEELEKDLLNEELVNDAPQSNTASDEDLLMDMPQSITQNTTAEEDIDAILADFLAEGEEDVAAADEAVPAFEDPDKPDFPDEPVTYCNYSNDYGNDGEEMKKKSKASAKEDKWQIALMGVACGLCVAIIGVMIYWLEAFLR